ncbi:MAG TPA: type II CAAX endopeptidase family protein [Chthoniobacterales bacterium]|jgi:membrane protease YdiL (CAAX protease family)|nr:type II CAAX endopeptidase family protein [Chthoniobacterales bacterium]
MFAGAFSSAVGNIFIALIVLGALAIYLTLIGQISARKSTPDVTIGNPPTRTFGLPEALLAAALILFLLLNIVASFGRSSPVHLNGRDLVANFLLSLFVVFLIAAVLKLRGIDIDSLAGFSKTTVKRAISTAIVLLVAAAPLILVAEGLTQTFLGGESSKQEIVDLFNNSGTIQERVMIIVLAVVVAPISEEFVFRFFIYGVFRRYFGVAIGLIFNALLFAAAHTHLPSAAPLFVLGACLTLAYEWSGSILVNMAMHALFNATQLFLLAFPELFRQ